MEIGQFVREYTTVRRAEGWGSYDPAYYRALPYRDLSKRFDQIWRIRARSFAVFLERVLQPIEREGRALTIADLGAGSGWLAARLTSRGHRVAAIDLLEDPLDGLGALRRYAAHVWPIVAEFDRLPLTDNSLDIAVFNAALHYSTDYATTLRESLRVLHPRGTLVILDTPMYSDPRSGARMVQEREARFQKTYGFSSTALPSKHFLTETRLDELANEVGLTWTKYWPRLDPQTTLSRTVNGLRARREPARFPVIAGTRV